LVAGVQLSHLEIESKGRWFRRPDGTIVDLGTRIVLQRLLQALIDQKLRSAGDPVPIVALAQHVWPGEVRIRDCLENRLRVSIAMLRKLGLGEYLVTARAGYLLHPSVSVIR
jgi:hypothetical protein